MCLCDHHVPSFLWPHLSPQFCLVCFFSSFFFLLPPLPARRQQGGMRASKVGCVTIATSWLTGRIVPFSTEPQGGHSRCSHCAAMAVCFCCYWEDRKHPCFEKIVHPQTWGGWWWRKRRGRGWSWPLLYISFHRHCPVCFAFPYFTKPVSMICILTHI